jgi:hypothetical protein
LRGCSVGISDDRDYDEIHWDGLRWHDKYKPSFTKIITCVQAILRFSFSEIWEVIEMGSCGIQRFINTGAGVQEILRFCLSNMKSCNVGTTVGEFGIGLCLEIEQPITPNYKETVDR